LGTGDIDDVILNVAGTLVGYLLFRLLWIVYQRFYRPSVTNYETEPV
jgi:glycopeptide antibiotics resistance protein